MRRTASDSSVHIAVFSEVWGLEIRVCFAEAPISTFVIVISDPIPHVS
jgi:hypothetical protein